MNKFLYKTATCYMAYALACGQAFAGNPESFADAPPPTSTTPSTTSQVVNTAKEVVTTTKETVATVQGAVTTAQGAVTEVKDEVQGYVNTAQGVVTEISNIPQNATAAAKDAAAEQLSQATGVNVAVAKEMMGTCSTPANCTSAAQKALVSYTEDAATLQLMAQTGMSSTMAEGLVKGCATSGGSQCAQVVEQQAGNYLTQATAQTLSQYTQYGSEANVKLAASCLSSGNSSECQQKAKAEAVNQLMAQTGLSSAEAEQLMEFAKNPSQYAANLKQMATNQVKTAAQAQFNQMLHASLGDTGLSLASLQSAKATYQAFAGLFKSASRSPFDGLGKISKNVEIRHLASVYVQKNTYAPAKGDPSLDYAKNVKDMAGTIKSLSSLSSSDVKSAATTVVKNTGNAAIDAAHKSTSDYVDAQLKKLEDEQNGG